MGSGGGSSGASVAASTVSREEEQCSNTNLGLSSHEASSSYPDESEIELGLGLSLGRVLSQHQRPRILTAKDLPSMGLRALKSSPPSATSSSASSLGVDASGGEANYHVFSSVGTKRAAETSPTRISQVVGWPPIRASRMNSLSNQPKAVVTGEINSDIGKNKGRALICIAEDMNKANTNDNGRIRGSLFVKVNMDGIGIGRKVDLSRHSSYESLAQTLEDMFTIPARFDTTVSKRNEISKAKRTSKLLDGLSDFVLTYEDKDGDWMLLGDVPFGLFLSCVKRLRIMKKSEANGLDQ